MFEKLFKNNKNDKKEQNKRFARKATNACHDFIDALVKIADETHTDRSTVVYASISAINKYRPAPELLKNWTTEESTTAREKLKAGAKIETEAEEKPEEYGEGDAYINLSVKKEKDEAKVKIDVEGNVGDQIQLIAVFLKDTAENIDVPKEKLLLMLADALFGEINEGNYEQINIAD